jgi:hypothetical protein
MLPYRGYNIMNEPLTTINKEPLTPERKFCLTLEDVANLLILENKDKIQTVRRLAGKGIIRGRKVANKWRFHRKAIEDYLLIGESV